MRRLVKRCAPAFLLMLAACSPSAATPQRDGAPLGAVRVAMPESEALPGGSRAAGAVAAWVASPDAAYARFGFPGEPPLLSLECRAGMLVVTRHTAAPVGAEALFALQGSRLILRLAVDATAVPGQRGYVWQGVIAPDDPLVLILEGEFSGTLPGGGRIAVPADDAPRGVISHCAGGADLPA
jgi:hypothetical protein